MYLYISHSHSHPSSSPRKIPSRDHLFKKENKNILKKRWKNTAPFIVVAYAPVYLFMLKKKLHSIQANSPSLHLFRFLQNTSSVLRNPIVPNAAPARTRRIRACNPWLPAPPPLRVHTLEHITPCCPSPCRRRSRRRHHPRRCRWGRCHPPPTACIGS